MNTILAYTGIFMGVIAFIAVLALLLAWPFMWMWNFAAVNALTVCQPITYWTAYVLMLFLGTFITGSRGSSSK